MARIKDSSKEAVKQAVDMVELVSGRTQLRRTGSRWMGRCPFHEERTPSFSVNPSEKLYYCFGCGARGDAIGFVEQTENLEFAEAVAWLADRFRVEIEYEESSPAAEAGRQRRKRLSTLLDEAATFYERYLWDSQAGSLARDYLAGRGLREEVCREFRLGLALGGQTLTRKALERGYTPAELRAAGLTNQRGNDYFARRLVFPLSDRSGHVCGFQARKLHEDDPLRAKYVNSPEGELFRKGAIVYGLDLARAAIAKEDRVCVVEGNPDAIALRQFGFEPVVASMGTALTEQQLKELVTLTRRLWLCFDGDAAGESATLRGMELAAALGFEVKVVALPPGLDPADAPELFAASLAKAEPYLVYRVRVEIERAADRQEGWLRAREVLGRFEDSPDRQDAVKLVADRLQLPRETLGGLAAARRSTAQTPEVSPRLLEADVRLERNVLAAMVVHPSLRPLLHELTSDHFDSEAHRKLRSHLAEGSEADAETIGLLAELDAIAARDAIDETTGRELFYRLVEREFRRELATTPDPQRTKELQEALVKIREAVAGIA
jgi:DNA primase